MNGSSRHVYINWSAYDELSDTVELTESIAETQLNELLRLRAAGVRLDAYIMDAFWYEPDSRYRAFRKRSWTAEGGARWIARCRKERVVPGLWFGCNSLGLSKVDPHPSWQASLTADGKEACWFTGPFCDDFFAAMSEWYGRGVRVFKLDFFSDTAVPPALLPHMTVREVQQQNREAFWRAGRAFRAAHPEAVLMGYNGYEDKGMQWQTDLPLRKHIDRRWYDVFDTLYCGDPRPADIPCHHFWRSKDIYSDHMANLYHRQGIPLQALDNAGFMVGTTGTSYWRGRASWRPMLLLALARGGRITTYYGDLTLLGDEDAAWMAQVQALYDRFHTAGGGVKLVGGLPGQGEAYGYATADGRGGLCTVVNPAQAVVEMPLPEGDGWRVLFADAGHDPSVRAGRVTLGPEQMAVLGHGQGMPGTLGRNPDLVVPVEISPVAMQAEPAGRNAVRTTVPWPGGILRAVVQQRSGGLARRSGVDWNGVRQPVDELIHLRVEQNGQPVPVTCNYGKRIWAGISWGVVESSGIVPSQPVTVLAGSAEAAKVELDLKLYRITNTVP